MTLLKKEIKEKIANEYVNGLSSVKLGEKYGVHSSTILYIVRSFGFKVRNNKQNSRKYTHNYSFFENIDTEEKAYWLGFMYADGYVSQKNGQKRFGISLSTQDKGHLYKFKSAINATNPISEYISKNGYKPGIKYCRLLMTSEKTFTDLINQGVLEHKTLKIMPPNIEEELISHFIRGYFDGDGCLTDYMHKKYRTYDVKILGTKSLLDWINKNIQKNTGIYINQYFKRKKTDTVYSLEYHAIRRTYKFLTHIYNDATVYLDRKYEHYLKMLGDIYSRVTSKRSNLKSLELSGKPLELAKLQCSGEKYTDTNA